MKNLEKIILELRQNGFLEDKPDILLVDIPTEKDLQKETCQKL